jgi:hypothetical protein
MRYNAAAAVADQGVAAIAKLVFRELGWQFRELSKCDVGIDAQIEVCTNWFATGKLIAVQVKFGASFFSEPAEGGFVYRGDLDHLEYYLSYALPVVVALYDPSTERAYWQHVAEKNVRRMARGWAMVVPVSQPIGAGAAKLWEIIATPRKGNPVTLKPVMAMDGAIIPLYEALHTVEYSIDFVTYALSSDFLAILDFVCSRKRVRGLIALRERDGEIATNLPEASQLQLRRLETTGDAYHERFLILDDRILCLGSANMTRSTRSNYELMSCHFDDERVALARQHFEELWARSAA